MITEELNSKEKLIIDILRNFSFLELFGYFVDNISYGGRELPSVIYKNQYNGMQVHFIGNETNYNTMILRKKKWALKKSAKVFEISDCFKYFDVAMQKNRTYTFKSIAEFIQNYLISVIKGEVWINDLIKDNNNDHK
jgi:hypothetical protein